MAARKYLTIYPTDTGYIIENEEPAFSLSFDTSEPTSIPKNTVELFKAMCAVYGIATDGESDYINIEYIA
jgi:hypothetical protein